MVFVQKMLEIPLLEALLSSLPPLFTVKCKNPPTSKIVIWHVVKEVEIKNLRTNSSEKGSKSYIRSCRLLSNMDYRNLPAFMQPLFWKRPILLSSPLVCFEIFGKDCFFVVAVFQLWRCRIISAYELILFCMWVHALLRIWTTSINTKFLLEKWNRHSFLGKLKIVFLFLFSFWTKFS